MGSAHQIPFTPINPEIKVAAGIRTTYKAEKNYLSKISERETSGKYYFVDNGISRH